jgi:hypothetical protein
VSEPTVEELTAQLESLRRRMAERDAADTGKAILDALTAAGYKPADPEAARILAQSAALTNPTDPAAAAVDLAKKHPAVFGQPAPGDGKGGSQTAEERAAFLRQSATLGAPVRPDADARAKALAAARAKPTDQQTHEERALILRASGIV